MREWRLRLIALVGLALSSGAVHAEPWLANKFANNCSSCHAPGRKNVEFKDRRCSLSCQSCHVNPNGGGLRNHYGKWNEDHWLGSIKLQGFLKSKNAPAPFPEQKYAKIGENRVIRKLFAKVGPPLVYAEGRPTDLHAYGPEVDKNFEEIVTAENRDDWLMTVPEEDPYREMDRSKVDGGGDFRFVSRYLATVRTSADGAEIDGTETDNFLLSGDIGLRFRPIHRHVHLVLENRYIGHPIHKVSDWNSEFVRRSMYALVDDLPYNSFGMVGIYKPQIGENSADHTILSEVVKSQTLVDNDESGFAYEGLSIGAAPGIPFVNLHVLGRQYINGKMANDSHLGFAANVGGRFTKYGLSSSYTFVYSNRDDLSGTEVKALIHDVTVGASLGRTTMNLDFMYYSKSVDEKTYINGTYFGGETNFRTWRDVYGFANLGYLTTSRTLRPGSSLQMRLGAKGFIVPGVQLSLAFVFDQDETTSETPNTDKTSFSQIGAVTQVHLYL